MLVRLSPSFSYLNEGYSSIFAINCEVQRLGQTGGGGVEECITWGGMLQQPIYMTFVI